MPTAVEQPDGRVALQIERADKTEGRWLPWEGFFDLFEEAELALWYRARQSGEERQSACEFVRRGWSTRRRRWCWTSFTNSAPDR